MGDLERENVRTITKKFKIYIKSKKFICNKMHLEDNKNSKDSSKAIRMHSFVKSRKLITHIQLLILQHQDQTLIKISNP